MQAPANQAPTATPRTVDDEIDLQRLWGLLRDNSWLIILVTAVSLLLGIAYALVVTPVLNIAIRISGKAEHGKNNWEVSSERNYL